MIFNLFDINSLSILNQFIYGQWIIQSQEINITIVSSKWQACIVSTPVCPQTIWNNIIYFHINVWAFNPTASELHLSYLMFCSSPINMNKQVYIVFTTKNKKMCCLIEKGTNICVLIWLLLHRKVMLFLH